MKYRPFSFSSVSLLSWMDDKHLRFYLETMKVLSKCRDETHKHFCRYLKEYENTIDTHKVEAKKIYLEAGKCANDIRNVVTDNFVRSFVTNYINSYEDLLKFGRFIFNDIYLNKRVISSPTNIEPNILPDSDRYALTLPNATKNSWENKDQEKLKFEESEDNLYWPLLEMIELNKYMYTVASTNYPTRLFQTMFVSALIDKNISLKLTKGLSQHHPDYKYIIYSMDNPSDYPKDNPLPSDKTLKDKQRGEIEDLVILDTNTSLEECKKWHPYIQPVGLEDKPFVASLVFIFIIDPIITQRDLYANLINILRY